MKTRIFAGSVIPHSRPFVGREEERAVVRVLRSGQLGGGEEVDRFEREMERYLGGGRATAVQTGTAALHLALLALGVGRGDRVLVPSYGCAALLHAVRYTGAEPLLADVLPETANLYPEEVRRRLRKGVKAMVVPHMLGRLAPVRELRRFGLPIIEDCAMALGPGTGLLGDLSVFSFYATKMIATGHGGMVVARTKGLADRIRDLVEYDNRDDDRVRYNYRMSAVVAALGRVQLSRIPDFVERRRRIADYYCRTLGLGRLPSDHLFYRFVLKVGPVDRFVRWMASKGIECKRPVYRPLHLYSPRALGDFKGAQELHRSYASIPLYPSLRRGEMDRVARSVRAGLP